MSSKGYRLPQNQTWEDTFKFLTWEQFPAVLERSIEYFAVLPEIGTYQHVNSTVRPFQEALLDTTGRQFTLSGVGSLIDYEKYGHQLKRPAPQLSGTGCDRNSLCLEPTCFGFVEGVIESNNVLQDICWSLSMPCLKDFYYSDMQFERKMKSYFAMFFQQAPAVLQAYQRTRLIKEAIKVVATDTNITWTGPLIGANNMSVPFYIDPVDATNFPNINNLPPGVGIGGANLMAFMHYVAPRIFSGAFMGGIEDIKIYGLKGDYMTAKDQTASVVDSYIDQQMLAAIRMLNMSPGTDSMMDSILGGNFIHDGLFPTFDIDGAGNIVPITQEILEPSTIAGYVQTNNPSHNLALVRGLLLVPDNWRFDLVAPPKDDFSDLGLGEAFNFRLNTPGSFPIMSSSMFTANQIGRDGTVVLGQRVGPDGNIIPAVRGTEPRQRPLQEAIRTEVLLTYANIECNNAIPGQLPNVGPAITPQGRADGFRLKSTMYIGTDVKGTAKPVLLLFQTDTPRSSRPVVVCNSVEVDVDQTGDAELINCCPGSQIYAILEFDKDRSSEFTVSDTAVYRSGPKGATYLVTITAISSDGKTITVESVDQVTLLPCCTGGSDDYGVMGELLNVTTATATSSEIMKAQYDAGSDSIFLEFFDPLVANVAGTAGTITLDDGTVINVELFANASGVFAQVEAASGEAFDLSTLDCACLINAVFSY